MQTKLLALLAVGGIASIRAQTVTDGDARAACNGFPRYALKCLTDVSYTICGTPDFGSEQVLPVAAGSYCQQGQPGVKIDQLVYSSATTTHVYTQASVYSSGASAATSGAADTASTGSSAATDTASAASSAATNTASTASSAASDAASSAAPTDSAAAAASTNVTDPASTASSAATTTTSA
ncbi:hypothetical protein OHC33_002610 [Knufia fluminis]|uniref:Uncharacterized protein n=1 Tax=Knufia fluminis TaxID=191047 RepID=A0AAN8EQ25_9EURO|nr:hypothetical protein OHC33_002610 [Knufia fluminis]